MERTTIIGNHRYEMDDKYLTIISTDDEQFDGFIAIQDIADLVKFLNTKEE